MKPVLSLENGQVALSGEWTLAALVPHLAEIQSALGEASASPRSWDLARVTRLDSAAASLIWRAWARRWPAVVVSGRGAAPDRRAGLPRYPPTPW